MVPNTSELLPEPETPVNTVRRRFGSSTLTSLRLFTRAPCTRIRSWLPAACSAGDRVSVLVAMLIAVSIIAGVAQPQPNGSGGSPVPAGWAAVGVAGHLGQPRLGVRHVPWRAG